ncbi:MULTISPECIES: hypothetical protein [unclassified Nodularia (in: cyanobacteria)]|uniref:SPOR domain-containing protein n=1 Tax=unclassified Nodularia (in: cyanobacteria) TaxID=2656917 RepID=UPI0018825E7F|nr:MULTISPECIES: hypothetical protein [unclassified Nodularia (in: cyanobacteria)]MBE9200158.1 hypothetical protein [Nodularia sp. LEGE 06071]MCC2694552.1 hypothetical protein [Nodularia sp. LEGE 04288]
MSQNPLIGSETTSSKTSGLKPPLAAALATLEVPIDQELARFRRTRIGVRIQNQSRMGSVISSQAPDLPVHRGTEGKITPRVANNTEITPAFILNETPQENPTSTPVKPDDFNLVSDSESIKTEIPQSSTNLSSSIVPAVVDADQNEHLAPANDHPSQPDDYLESSEALLRSLTDEQQSTEKPSNSNDSLLSPLGIGSMLLLLVASITLGYVMFNPNSQDGSGFNLGRLFQTESSPNSEENTVEVGSNTQVQAQPELTPILKYPNLAAKEFPEVRNPTDVVGLQPKVKPTPSPIVTQAPVIPPQMESLPQLQPVIPVDVPPTSRAEITPPLSAAATNLPNANAKLKPAADGFYHIVMDNQSDRALSNAQKVVPDAYLSPGQTLIYLAAVKTPEEAQQRVQKLQSQGIKARVQQP